MTFKMQLVQLFESIRLQDGKFFLLDLHQQRMEQSRSMLFGIKEIVALNELLRQYPVPDKGLYKCRLSYGIKIAKPEYTSYQQRKVKSLRLVYAQDLNYEYKFIERTAINHLFGMRGTADDVLIVRDGFITDSSICNSVFRYNNEWVTPEKPLLKGVQREYLLRKGLIREIPIPVKLLRQFDSFKLINAMIPWEAATELPIDFIG